LQYIGTEVFRDNFDKNVWINIVKQEIEVSDENIVVSDCRFLNEVEMLKTFDNVFFINIRRSGDVKDEHQSAQELKIDGSFVINNIYDIDSLYEKVDQTMDEILAIIEEKEKNEKNEKNEKENSLKID